VVNSHLRPPTKARRAPAPAASAETRWRLTQIVIFEVINLEVRPHLCIFPLEAQGPGVGAQAGVCSPGTAPFVSDWRTIVTIVASPISYKLQFLGVTREGGGGGDFWHLYIPNCGPAYTEGSNSEIHLCHLAQCCPFSFATLCAGPTSSVEVFRKVENSAGELCRICDSPVPLSFCLRPAVCKHDGPISA